MIHLFFLTHLLSINLFWSGLSQSLAYRNIPCRLNNSIWWRAVKTVSYLLKNQQLLRNFCLPLNLPANSLLAHLNPRARFSQVWSMSCRMMEERKFKKQEEARMKDERKKSRELKKQQDARLKEEHTKAREEKKLQSKLMVM